MIASAARPRAVSTHRPRRRDDVLVQHVCHRALVHAVGQPQDVVLSTRALRPGECLAAGDRGLPVPGEPN
jgi:hypothetical protein